MIHALDVVASKLWVMEPSALRTLAEIAGRAAEHPLDVLQTRDGKPLDNTRISERRGATAVIPVVGPIMRYANLFTRISGATSVEVLAKDLQAALDDPTIQSIVLNVDSPGGEVNGVNELSQLVYFARQQKPIISYVGGTAASGAYWIASSASKVIADQTALLGSIGVVSTLVDTRERDAKDGVKTYQIVSSNAPNKRPDIATDEGRAQVQDVVDQLENIFVLSVARNRGVTPTTVRSDFGRGGVMVASQAIKAGMADGTSMFENLIRAENTRAGISGYQESSPLRLLPKKPATAVAAPAPKEAPKPASYVPPSRRIGGV